MDPKLIEFLACPVCKGRLIDSGKPEGELVCLACSLAFSVKEGIPDMIAHDARKIQAPEAEALRVRQRPVPAAAR